MKLISTQFLLLAIFIVISVSLAAFAPLIEKKFAFKTGELPAQTGQVDSGQLAGQKSSSSAPQTLKFGDKIFKVDIANTIDSRATGLSGRKSLAADAGLLFVFDTPARYGFWMKDMNFPIDILWLDDSGKVVFIEKNVKPATFPKVFYPSVPASFVLEINAGVADTLNIKIGSKTCDTGFLSYAESLTCA